MRYLGSVVALLFSPLAPNHVWLAPSTARIENASGTRPGPVAYIACENTHAPGPPAPGRARFRSLEACGDDTLEIVPSGEKYCQTCVEGEPYRVVVKITGHGGVECNYDDPLSRLFVLKLLD